MALKINPQTGTIQNDAGGGITLEPGGSDLVTVNNGMLLPDGTVTEPGLRFSDDTNTGVYSPQNDTVAIAGEGADIIRLRGVASAANYLHVTPATTGNDVLVEVAGSDTNINLSIDSKGTGKVKISGLSYPDTDGTTNNYLKTNGAGDLAFAQIDYTEIANAPTTVVNIEDLSNVAIGDLKQGSSLKFVNDTWQVRPDWTVNALQSKRIVANMFYGTVGALGTTLTATIAGIVVTFDITTKGTVQFGQTASNAEDMAVAINRDMQAAGESRIIAYNLASELFIVRSSGGSISIANGTGDTGGIPFSGTASASGIELTTNAPSTGTMLVQGDGYETLQVGTNGQVLTADSAEELGVKWTEAGTASPLTTKGDIYTYSTTEDRLAVGSFGQVLTADANEATGVKWATPTGVGGTVGTVSSIDFGTITGSGNANIDAGSFV